MAARELLISAVFCGLLLFACSLETESLVDITRILVSQEGCPFVENIECPNSNISYYLYTRDTQDSPYQLDPSRPETLEEANFTVGAPLKVIFHGYTGHKDFSPNKELRPAYFQKGEYNIITVDWGKLAPAPCYYEAAHNVEVAGKCTAALLDMLLQTRSELSLANTHILGFSLGAHVAGVTAANLTTGTVPRVTGFDPALPLFDQASTPPYKIIRPEVADFVDVYHTHAGLQGKKALCGHVDVYFNNATSQLGCNCDGSCDHLRAVEFFTESINSEIGMWGFSCDNPESFIHGLCPAENFVALGDSIAVKRGTYMVVTNSESPFLLSPLKYRADSDLSDRVSMYCPLHQYLSAA